MRKIRSSVLDMVHLRSLLDILMEMSSRQFEVKLKIEVWTRAGNHQHRYGIEIHGTG